MGICRKIQRGIATNHRRQEGLGAEPTTAFEDFQFFLKNNASLGILRLKI